MAVDDWRVDGHPPAHPPRERVLNEHWPLCDRDGTRHARGIQDRPADQQIPVTVRLVLERRGEVWLAGTAVRWHGESVYVAVDDRDILGSAAWVHASDVRRR